MPLGRCLKWGGSLALLYSQSVSYYQQEPYPRTGWGFLLPQPSRHAFGPSELQLACISFSIEWHQGWASASAGTRAEAVLCGEPGAVAAQPAAGAGSDGTGCGEAAPVPGSAGFAVPSLGCMHAVGRTSRSGGSLRDAKGYAAKVTQAPIPWHTAGDLKRMLFKAPVPRLHKCALTRGCFSNFKGLLGLAQCLTGWVHNPSLLVMCSNHVWFFWYVMFS